MASQKWRRLQPLARVAPGGSWLVRAGQQQQQVGGTKGARAISVQPDGMFTMPTGLAERRALTIPKWLAWIAQPIQSQWPPGPSPVALDGRCKFPPRSIGSACDRFIYKPPIQKTPRTRESPRQIFASPVTSRVILSMRDSSPSWPVQRPTQTTERSP